jgi:hypothetical protein
MIRFLFPLFFCFCASAQTNWVQTKWLSNGQWQQFPVSTSTASVAWFPLPTYGYSTNNRTVVSFVTTTNISGDFTGKTLTATFEIRPKIRDQIVAYGGYLDAYGNYPGWNTGTLPANVRLFFTSYPLTYFSSYGLYHFNDFFWSTEGAIFNEMTGTVTISAVLDPLKWTNAVGQVSPDWFNATIANCRQIGLSFGGGSFYDVGVGILEGTGGTTFYLNAFSVL